MNTSIELLRWRKVNNSYYPIITIDGIEAECDLQITTPQTDEDLQEYQEQYGFEIEYGRWYYFDGECYHNEYDDNPNPHNPFRVFMAEEVDSALFKLNNNQAP